MAQGRSLVKEIIKNFINSFKPRNIWGELKGKDQNGTEYYESANVKRGRRPSRWFAPPKGSDFTQELPVEWEAWLKHKRKVPPTVEEIELNYQKKLAVLENAKKLEKSKTLTQDEVKNVDKPAFPVYEEYKSDPFEASKERKCS